MVDTLLVTLNTILHTQVAGHINILHLVMVAAGTLFPIVIGIILPRKRCIGYGMFINKTLGLALLQKGVKFIPTNILENIIATVQSTFQDVAFGVYISSRLDLTPEDRQKKIDEYLTTVKPVAAPVKEPKPQVITTVEPVKKDSTNAD